LWNRFVVSKKKDRSSSLAVVAKRKSLSKIIRYSSSGSAVVIGDRLRDVSYDESTVHQIQEQFPGVELTLSPDGDKVLSLLEASRVVQVHKDALDKVRRSAYDEGKHAGYEQGKTEQQKETQRVVQQFEDAIKQAVSQRRQLLEETRQQALELILKIARKVTFDAVQVDPSLTLKIIHGVIDQLIDKSNLTVRVNPAHLDTIKNDLGHFLPDSAEVMTIRLEPDARVKIGGCLIDTSSDSIDARIESQFLLIEQSLLSQKALP
jgi:flagellar biosynthesis/type III secretory pathway protein FliH